MKPGHKYCKQSYIGSPVKAIAHVCPCGSNACTCGHEHAGGICSAVVDDASGKVYLYGNVVHENYHVPGNACVAYTAVESAGFTADGRLGADEVFTTADITLAHIPFKDNSLLVFKNGLKLIQDTDYTLDEKNIHINGFVSTDRVEVMYEYGAE